SSDVCSSDLLAAFDATTLVNNYVQCNLCGERHLVDNSTVKVFPSEPPDRR
ncbi:MAG: hypothetical protein JOY98_07340, partial [Candidatus Eremiobacteraeota bacterium]|nr:hypothetical protein [Candidatus Eremiobacteraeota bacterium]